MKQYISGTHIKVWWICNKEHERSAQISNRNKKNNPSGCPKCKSSKLEKKLLNTCKTLNLTLITEHKFPQCKNINPLPFDGYIQQHNILVELDGIQHFQNISHFHRTQTSLAKRKTTDRKKSQFVWNNGYHMLRISYLVDHGGNRGYIEAIFNRYI